MLTELVHSNDDRHLKMQKERLVEDFSKAVNEFQTLQKKTVDIEKNQIRAAYSNNATISMPPNITSNKGGSYSMDTFASTNNRSQQGQGQMQTQLQEDVDLQALEEQERTIRELEVSRFTMNYVLLEILMDYFRYYFQESIVGVNEIYKNLGALVFEQGHMVDSIEQYVENTSIFVSDGTENLQKASHYRNQARKKKLIILSVLVSVILIVVLVMSMKN